MDGCLAAHAAKQFFMVRLEDRSADMLLPIIHKYIRPGTKIISDEWKAYIQMQNQGIEHGTICHKRNFVSPDDPSVHTQNIENLWRYAKAVYPDNSTSECLKESYLHEFAYRKRFGENTIHQILHDIKEVYDWHKTFYEEE